MKALEQALAGIDVSSAIQGVRMKASGRAPVRVYPSRADAGKNTPIRLIYQPVTSETLTVEDGGQTFQLNWDGETPYIVETEPIVDGQVRDVNWKYPHGTDLLWRVVYRDPYGVEFYRAKLSGAFEEAAAEAGREAQAEGWAVVSINRRF